MAKKLWYVGAWLGATLLAVVVASAAVGAVRSEAEQPSATSPYFNTTTTTDAGNGGPTSSTGANSAPTTTASTSTSTSTTLGSGSPGSSTTSTTTTTQPSGTTSTSTSTTTTTITTAPRTYILIGGSVAILASDPNVTLVGAVPNAGFTVEVEDDGPGEVRVEFSSESDESEFRARWEDGELRIDIDED